jgi:hypothetical protein
MAKKANHFFLKIFRFGWLDREMAKKPKKMSFLMKSRPIKNFSWGWSVAIFAKFKSVASSAQNSAQK